MSDAPDDLGRFLRGLAHELRTPLGSILILTELLAEGPEALAPRQSDKVRKIGLAALGLKEIVEQVSTYAKCADGRLTALRRPVDWEELLDDLRRAFAPEALDQARELTLELEPGTPRAVITDREILRRVTGLLLEHALGGRSERPIRLAVRHAASEMLVTVRGGLDDDGGDTLFEPFPPGPRRAGGTALTLPLARALAGVLGGRLRADGDALLLSLPLEPADQA